MPKKTKEIEINETTQKTGKKETVTKKTETTKSTSKKSSNSKTTNVKKKPATTSKTAKKGKNSTTTKTAATAAKSKKATTTKTATTAAKSKKVTTTKTAVTAAKSKKVTTTKTTATATRAKKTTKKAVSKNILDNTLSTTEYYDLPYRYNQTVVKILAQTPNSLFVYWDISDGDIENYKKQYGENFFEITKPILIVHNDTLGYSFEVDINDFANSWYLNINNSKCDYRIELGRRIIENKNLTQHSNQRLQSGPENLVVFDNKKEAEDNYIYIASSNEIETPNDHILLEKFPKNITFRNVKNNYEYSKKVEDLPIAKSMNKIYNINDIYKLIYQQENIEEFYNLNNPSSGGNSSSTTFSSVFK